MKGSIRCLDCGNRMALCKCQGPARRQLRVYGGVDPLTHRKRQVTLVVRGSKREAERQLTTLLKSVHEGEKATSTGTLAELLDRWVRESERLKRSPGTIHTNRQYIAHNILPAELEVHGRRVVLGQVQLADLTAEHLDALYGVLDDRGMAPATIIKHHAIISAALNQARKWRWVSENVATFATKPSLPFHEVDPPSPEEVRQLLLAAEKANPVLAVLLWTAATTGARRGELCALRRSAVDVENRVMKVAFNLVDIPGELTLKDTKTHQVRYLSLDDGTVAVLQGLYDRQEAEARMVGVRLAKDPFVFSQDVACAAPYRPDRVTGAFRRLKRQEGLQHVNLHHLRHFMATQAIAAGADIRTVAGRLGHGGGGVITMRIYSHVLKTKDREIADQMGQLMIAPPAEPIEALAVDVMDEDLPMTERTRALEELFGDEVSSGN